MATAIRGTPKLLVLVVSVCITHQRRKKDDGRQEKSSSGNGSSSGEIGAKSE